MTEEFEMDDDIRGHPIDEPYAESVAEPEPIGRCEWCPDKVWPDQHYLVSSGYVWHEECAERCSSLLDAGTLIDGAE